MVSQNFNNSNMKTLETGNSIDTESQILRQKNENLFKKNCILFSALLLCVFLLNIYVLFVVMNKNSVIRKLQNDVEELKKDVSKLKLYHSTAFLMQEISDFEYQDDDNTGPTSFYNDYYSDYHSDYTDASKGEPNYVDDPESNEVFTKDDKMMKIEKSSTTEKPRAKRELLAATIDGVSIIAEPYAEAKRKNKTLAENKERLRLYDSLVTPSGGSTKTDEHIEERIRHHGHHQKKFQTAGWSARTFVNQGQVTAFPGASPTPVMSRTSRVMLTDQEKLKTQKKFVHKTLLKTGATNNGNQRNYQELVESVETTNLPGTGRTHRHRKPGTRRSNIESMGEGHSRMRYSVPVAHFGGDTSKYIEGKHHHYRGNGHLAHPEGHYVDWVPSDWVRSLEMERFFHMHNGELTIKEAGTGLYFIYAQIYYIDEHDLNGYKIYKNNGEIAQCTTMTLTERRMDKRNTCYTATVEYLTEGDKLTIRDIESMRYAFFEKGKSFFGLFKISDAKVK